MKLQPSLQSKRRYLLIRGAGKEEIEQAILDYVGILGWAKAAPFFIGGEGKEIILAVERKEIDNIKAALALSAEKINVIRVSGTLKGLGKKRQ